MSVFDSLVGQEAVIEQLQAAARGVGMTHAWLFTGPPGSGRSVAARAFAAALQCTDAGCGHCSACQQALGGTHPDVKGMWKSTCCMLGHPCGRNRRDYRIESGF